MVFLKEPESQTAAEGESVMFECEAGGFPAPKVSKSLIVRIFYEHQCLNREENFD